MMTGSTTTGFSTSVSSLGASVGALGNIFGVVDKAQNIKDKSTSVFKFVGSLFTTTVTVHSSDDAFNWMAKWLAQCENGQLTKKKLKAGEEEEEEKEIGGSSKINKSVSRFNDIPIWSSRSFLIFTEYVSRVASHNNTATIRTAPAEGSYLIRFKGKLMRVKRTREVGMFDNNRGTPFETLQITYLGFNKKWMNMIIQEIKDISVVESGQIMVYTNNESNWRKGLSKNKRPIFSVVLPDSVVKPLLSDVSSFLKSSKWYLERGIPYRRGYLIHGPPGVGKSSFISAIAGEHNLNICLVNLSNSSLDDGQLSHLMSNTPANCVLVIEDIDTIFDSRDKEDSKNDSGGGLTLSGLLNALDGVASQEGRMVFMTTNYIDRLDPALTRPGRMDYIAEFPLASRSQIGKLFRIFYPEVSQELADKFAENFKDGERSPAQIQSYLLRFKESSEDAIFNVGNFDTFVRG